MLLPFHLLESLLILLICVRVNTWIVKDAKAKGKVTFGDKIFFLLFTLAALATLISW